MNITVIGGGLGGLACATMLAKTGARVTLHERAGERGGRARSQKDRGFAFDQGPHALYLGGAGEEVLRSLDVPLDGAIPEASGSLARMNDRLLALPVGMTSLLSTDLLAMADKLELGWLLLRIGSAEAKPNETLSAWIDDRLKSPAARSFAHALFRLTTYANDPDRMDAGAAIARLQQVTKHNVMYVHGGWQTLVDALEIRAHEAGVTFANGIESAIEKPRGAVILAVGPRAAHALFPNDRAIAQAAAEAIPARAATLQVALSKLPIAENRFILGIDRPTYLSVHSLTARVAPEGQHVVHVAKYLAPRKDDGDDGTREELEAELDLAQPGWREHVVHARFLPSLVVTNDIPRADGGGFVRADTPGVHVVADWADAPGMLLDRVLDSARRAVDRIRKEDVAAA